MKLRFVIKILFFVQIVLCLTGCKREGPRVSEEGINLHGEVIKVADGDTFTILDSERNIEDKIRLIGIDCPEIDQEYGIEAKEYLETLILNKNVDIAYQKRDQYGRVLGNVFIDGMNVSEKMLEKGLAWHFIKYSDDPVLEQIEKVARNNKIGLWASQEAIAPWEFRKMNK